MFSFPMHKQVCGSRSFWKTSWDYEQTRLRMKLPLLKVGGEKGKKKPFGESLRYSGLTDASPNTTGFLS